MIYSCPGFLDAATCRRIRGAMDDGVADAAEVLDGTVALREDLRRASSIDVDPALVPEIEEALDRQREAVEAFFGLRLGRREGPGFIRYRAGDFYRAHRDRARVASWPDAIRRRIALVAFLSGPGELEGGCLRIYEPTHAVDVHPDTGRLVAFPAECLHEVTPVRAGTRDVIVDWFYDAEKSDIERE